MHDHEFEKQVQQKMADLRMQPSESVWEEVDKRLHNKERNRRWVILLPLLLLSLSLSGYLLYGIFFPTATDPEMVLHNSPIIRHQQDSQFVTGRTRDPFINSERSKDEANTTVGDVKGTNRFPLRVIDKSRSVKRPDTQSRNKAPELIKNAGYARINIENVIPEQVPLKDADLILVKSGAEKAKKNLYRQDSITDAPEAREPILAQIGSITPQAEINTTLAIKNQRLRSDVSVVKLNRSLGLEWGIQIQGGRSGLITSPGKSVFSGGAQSISGLPGSNLAGVNPIPFMESNHRPGFGFTSGVVLYKDTPQNQSIARTTLYSIDHIHKSGQQDGGFVKCATVAARKSTCPRAVISRRQYQFLYQQISLS
ncbi:MAG: hypothetical protein WKF97_25780 [Chitinophagaceae bacterium]